MMMELHRQRSFDVADLHRQPPPPPLVSQLSLQSTGGKSTSSSASKKKQMALKILLLDDSVTIIQAQAKAPARVVFEQICKQLNILEADYFGLEYLNQDSTCGPMYFWLDLEKRLSHQIGLSMTDPVLRFSVKFYTPDPSQLEEEFTRYLYSLQIRKDLASGQLTCNDNTASLMASYLVQAECGDFNEEDYPDSSYLKTHLFVPNQDDSIEYRIRENHKKHIGQSPGEADLHLLETARRTEFYGIRMYPAKDDDGVLLNVSVCHMGVLVFQNYTKINTFSWGKVRKLSFKRKKFILKLHPEGFGLTEGYYKEVVEFTFSHRNECKAFWKCCVEHHSFFRCDNIQPLNQQDQHGRRSKSLLSSRGSSFRYSGRTQKQMVSFVRENFIKRSIGGGATSSMSSSAQATPNSLFQRSSSFRSAATTTPVQSHHQPQIHSHAHHQHPSHSGVSTSCSSPAVIERHQGMGGSPSTEDSFSPGTSINSSPQQQQLPPQQQQLYAADNHPQQDPPDWFYYLMRELIQTQRTFTSDLKLISSPLLHSNEQLLQQLESSLGVRKELWEETTHGLYSLSLLIKHFESHFEQWNEYLNGLDVNKFEENYEFYLPAVAIASKPIYRLIYLEKDFLGVLRRNAKEGETSHAQINIWTEKFVHVLSPLAKKARTIQPGIESQCKIIELTREMIGSCDIHPGEFLRQGLMLKLSSKRGLQSRIFFLFTDVLMYGSRISSASGFRLHGIVPLYNCTFNEEQCDPISYSFTIQTGGDEEKLLVLGATSAQDKGKWLAALREAQSRSTGYNSKLVAASSNELTTNPPPSIETNNNTTIVVSHRANATTHVCWHRNLSFDQVEICRALEYSLSGYLLRKFKNSPGWQRLFVVFTNICLFFYKTHEEPQPLTSLPLLGYIVATPNSSENVDNKRHVFKLVFKTHVYYFRAESPFTFKRWMQVLQSSTSLTN